MLVALAGVESLMPCISPREPTLFAHDAPKPTHAALRHRRVRAAMAVDADEFVAGNAILTSRLARDRSEDLDLAIGGIVIVAMVAPLLRPLAAVWVEVVHVAHLDLLDALQGLPVEIERCIDTLTLLVVTLIWLLDCAWDGVGLRERSDILCKLGPGSRSRRSGGCNGGGERVVTVARDLRLTVAVLDGGSRRPGAWSHDCDARHDLASAEDLGERDRLEGHVHVRGNALEQRHTSREPVFVLRIRVQKLRSAAEDDLVAVVIVKEQLEVIWEKLARKYKW